MTENSSARALVIDDNAPVRCVIHDIVEELGYTADEAANGAEGLELFARNRYDVVLTDILMPGMTGWDVLAAVRRHNPEMPVLLVTGSAVLADDPRVTQPGVGLVRKPLDVPTLGNALTRVLEKRG